MTVFKRDTSAATHLTALETAEVASANQLNCRRKQPRQSNDNKPLHEQTSKNGIIIEAANEIEKHNRQEKHEPDIEIVACKKSQSRESERDRVRECEKDRES